MIKIINYLFQSLLIYSFFILGRILGLKISRKLFSFLFILIGPFFKSKKIVEKNIKDFLFGKKLSFLEVNMLNCKIKKLPRPTDLIKIKN